NGERLAGVDASFTTKYGVTTSRTLLVPLSSKGATDFTDTPTLYLHVGTTASNLGANPFYFLSHFGATSNVVEAMEGPTDSSQNDTVATAEQPPLLLPDHMAPGYYVAGHLHVADNDVDVFALDLDAVPNISSLHIHAVCGARYYGSGLESFKMTLLQDDGVSILDSGIEGATSDIDLGETTIPPGASTLYLQVETTGLLPDHAGTHYACRVGFFEH